MNTMVKMSHVIQPDVVRRACGGFLATSPKGARVAIGVTADTQEGAVEKFCSVYNRWIEILSAGGGAAPQQAGLDVPI